MVAFGETDMTQPAGHIRHGYRWNRGAGGGVGFFGAEFELNGSPGGDWGYWERGKPVTRTRYEARESFSVLALGPFS
jgi:hypothetical protein